MSELDLSTLPKRIQFAADVMSEVITRCAELKEGRATTFSPDKLRAIADEWQRSEERAAFTEELARALYAGHQAFLPNRKNIQVPFDEAPESIQRHTRALASHAIESGWRRDA